MYNADAEWDRFRPNWYQRRHYRSVRDDDRRILTHTRDHFAAHAPGEGAVGLDVGPGPNLYPALAMLPFCSRVDLIEYSSTNVQWLQRRAAGLEADDGEDWAPFWAVLAENAAYAERGGDQPLRQVADKVVVTPGSVFDLPEAQWDVGTMFFVACSISSEVDEFYEAVRCFLHALRPGAPFAAAFMIGSDGYQVDGVEFPAVRVGQTMIEEAIRDMAGDAKVIPIPSGGGDPLRDGVEMALALGLRAG
ncbi:methyltransferase [Dactylosporangium vinaceum]|uniref:SCO2525 family SAM-dependent methyltransferase n=1 Tax=Dactylosporangium vinaceum TaxID=53362 RepID=UPI001CA7C098|nr:SCO2525 family SAM-dependent methyltransferase [Dactylosporangium vinaceum]UAB97630.1 methyltransferase [Dactylosporangium vinaceum]